MRTSSIIAGLILGSLLAGCGSPAPLAPTPLPPAASRAVLLDVSPGELLMSGSQVTVSITTRLPEGGAAGVPVQLTVDNGRLSQTRVVTDTTGHARVVLEADQTVHVTAVAAGATTPVTIRVPAIEPWRLYFVSTSDMFVLIPRNVPAAADPLGLWHGHIEIFPPPQHAFSTPARVRLSCGGQGTVGGDFDVPGFTGVRAARCVYRSTNQAYFPTVEAIAANGWTSRARVEVRTE